MKIAKEIQRREFLRQATGTAGAAALFAGWSAPRVDAAETGKASRRREAVEPLLAELEGKGRQMLSVPRKDGQFLHLLVKASRAKSVLEIGTSHGYSAIWMSLALEETGGKMTTIEIRPDRVELAKANVGKAGLSHRVTFKEGDAHQIVPTLDGPFDFVFLDADKSGQVDYFNKLFPKKLAPGAIIAVHNAIRSAGDMKDYFDLINAHPEFDSIILSLTMQDGFSVSYRHRV